MKRDPQRPDAEEAELLEHFRRHSDEQPSAQLDARILAAARAAARPSQSPWARLGHWLFGRPQRWPVALAGVATLGVGLSLALRTFEQAPRYDAPVPAMAPAPQAEALSRAAQQAAPALYSAPAAPAAAPEQPRALAESASMADEAAPMAKRSAKVAEAPAEPETSLRRLAELQRQGDQAAAARLRDELRRRYPQLDVEGELRRLEARP
ncbi:hypothetical protein [Pseudomonas citronellolis]|uniref:hypothetical protein n=1 Tax=Pseudomonas citronellolis TaxID=53408 RepID=UPI0023E469C4|nr:hypothetical protein [Pseudomonas citronellolis]MDF3932060.1 hypothetical protein [Pseudomonas citronellolis]